MKHSKKLLMMLMAFAFCAVFAVCGSAAGKAEDMTSDQTNDIVKTAHIGVIAWSTGMADEYEFIQSVQAIFSEQYSDQIVDVFIKDAGQDASMLPLILGTMNAMWAGEKIVILIVNDDNGFNDEALLGILKDAEKDGIIAGIDHAIDGAPESTFVYDASDAVGCVAMILENAFN